MRFGLVLTIMFSLLFVLSPDALAQKKKKKKLNREIVGPELAFGRKAAEFGLWNEAIFRWEKVIKHDPNNADAMNNLAVAYESVGNYTKANQLYEDALALDEDSAAIRKNLKRFRGFYRKHRRQLERDQQARAAKKAAQTEQVEQKAAAKPVDSARKGTPIKSKKKGTPIKAKPKNKQQEKQGDSKGGLE